MVPYVVRKENDGWWGVGTYYKGSRPIALFRYFEDAERYCNQRNGKGGAG
jgi:hypothetical protein